MTPDKTDLAILQKLQEPTKKLPTRKELAKQIDSPLHPGRKVAEQTLSHHIEKLEEAGIIKGYHTILDAEKIGLSFISFAHVHLEKYSRADLLTFHNAMHASPYVLECYTVSDKETDYLLKLATPTRQKYYETMQDFLDLPGVTRYVTAVVLHEVKNTTVLPLDHVPKSLH